MHILKIDLNMQNGEPLSVSFERGLNFIFSENPGTLEQIRTALADLLFVTEKTDGCGEATFVIGQDEFTLPEQTRENKDSSENRKGLEKFREIFSRDIFLSTCSHDMDSSTSGLFPEAVKDVLLKNQLLSDSLNTGSSIEELGKKISEADREKQILEIKGLRKDKLQKELHAVKRGIGKLEKKKASLEEYLNNLYKISELNVKRKKLTSEITALKDELMNLEGIKKKIASIEQKLESEFPYLAGRLSSDEELDRMQEQFSEFRDISGRIDSYFTDKKVKTAQAAKHVAAAALSASVIFAFLMSRSPGSLSDFKIPLILTGSALALAAAAVTVRCIYIIKKAYPRELIEKKKVLINKISEEMKHEIPEEKGIRAGELYEFLLQYFDDFVKFDEINTEISELKKKMNSSFSIQEGDKKMAAKSRKLQDVRDEIESLLSGLDTDLYPAPDPESSEETVHDLKDILAETEKELLQENNILDNINSELGRYGPDNDISCSGQISRIEEELAAMKKELAAASFIEDLIASSSEIWLEKQIAELSENAAQIFPEISGTENPEHYGKEFMKKFFSRESAEQPEHVESDLFFSLSYGMTKLMSSSEFLPPLVISSTSEGNTDKIVEKLNKIMLELSGIRQVIILTSNPVNPDQGRKIKV